eukprot:CAMPEP_0196148426 /NCGR_PEP_ID=MMETSP0910-20130528/27699_1 /TAXON_ID=49265 /ORGANISM="Thalassiosira rotula, Strain GSO102" /LENGTH=523 /DNA_ID=CAMNT_0041411127 /DNA_START=35 /DNA_END=1606 /DNA_ORIENTATION=+
MTKIEEPVLPPCKKRSWSTTLHGRTPFLRYRHFDGSGDSNNHPHHPPYGDLSATNAKYATKGTLASSTYHQHQQQQHQQQQMAIDEQKMNMQSILERYHSLALTHYAQTKRRRLESATRSTQNSQRIEQLTALHKMAQDTLNFCTKVLRSEENTRREDERERRDVEEEMRNAEREKALAEEFLSRFGSNAGMSGDGGGRSDNNHGRSAEGVDMNRAENIENEGRGRQQEQRQQPHGVRRIGGIPSKFLDLSHFPKLQKSFHEGRGGGAKRDAVFSPEEADGKQIKRPIIDCTDETASPHRHDVNRLSNIGDLGCRSPMRIPSFGGVPQEVAIGGGSTKQSKQNTKRIYISNASLSHVNGTYIQEGCYNDAPLFVRVGPPRKFMGKWDCSVVLRREAEEVLSKRNSLSGGGGGPPVVGVEYTWKIGLVPAHRITHPRIIGYYTASEDSSGMSGSGHRVMMPISKRVSNVDRMEEDDDDEESGMYFEPPVEGWRVFQEARHVGLVGGVGNATLGRASSLTVSYEE